MYYSIENKTDKEVGNVFPQASCINQNLAHSIQFDEFSNFDSEIIFHLEPKSKLTDVLSQAAISADGLLISQKLRGLLSDFNIINHKYYKCLVKNNNNITIDYYWLHISDYPLLNKINFKESKFYTKKFGYRESDISLSSFSDYKIQKENLGKMWGIGADFIKLNNDFDSSLDLFHIPIFGRNLYASEKLMKKLKESQVTGILIKEEHFIA